MPDIQVISLVGKMHPLLVHLPIGILLAGFLLHWLSRNGKNPSLRPALLPVYLAGCISAFISCISGYLLSRSGEYDISVVALHQWMGIGVAAISLVLFLGIRGLRWFAPYTHFFAIMLSGGLIYTAHLGGTLTHGNNFLFNTSSNVKAASILPLENAQEAMVYSDIITPILQEKCYSCHGPEKQKGKLRLDGKEYILKGGKNGKVISPESDPEPEMLKRILLPPDDEDHMPPKEKRQLTKNQVILISWWLNEGASFTARSKELKQSDTIKNVLASLEKGVQGDQQADIVTDIPVLPEAPKELVDSLKRCGAIVLPLTLSANALSVNLINVTSASDTLWSQLSRLRTHVYYLTAEGPLIGDDAMKAISTLLHLRKLNIANTSITDEGLIRLKGLEELVSLNLTGTKISGKGLEGLRPLKKLKQVYVYRTAISRNEMEKIKLLFPGVLIETGGYSLPLNSKDTQVVIPNNPS